MVFVVVERVSAESRSSRSSGRIADRPRALPRCCKEEPVVEFQPPLQRGALIRRYKRFLADVEAASGERITMHCPNTGAMHGCAEPGSAVWYSTSDDPRRKYRHTLEIVRAKSRHLVAIHSARANALVAEALADGRLPALPSESGIKRETRIPGRRGRFDLLAGDVLVEVKAVTLRLADSGAFPDAVSTRASRHVTALAELARGGRRCAVVFCILHNGIRAVRPADEIDPAFGIALRRAAASGVGVFALRCRVSAKGIVPVAPAKVDLRAPATA